MTPTENKKTLIEAKKGDYIIGTYMDISMFRQVGDKTPDFISQLNKKIKISIVIPEQLRNTDNGTERIYQVLHHHDEDAEAEILTGIYDESTFTYTFETDRFSTYAIAYKDSGKPAGGNENNENDKKNESNENNENHTGSTPDNPKTNTVKKDNIPETDDSGKTTAWLWILALSGIGISCFGKMAAKNTVFRKK